MPSKTRAADGIKLEILTTAIVSNRAHAGPIWEQFRDAIERRLSSINYSSRAYSIVFRPMISDGTRGAEWVWDEFVKYHRGGGIQVGVNIDYQSWDSGSETVRLDLLFRALRHGLEKIKQTYISRADLENVFDALKLAHDDLKDTQVTPYACDKN